MAFQQKLARLSSSVKGLRLAGIGVYAPVWRAWETMTEMLYQKLRIGLQWNLEWCMAPKSEWIRAYAAIGTDPDTWVPVDEFPEGAGPVDVLVVSFEPDAPVKQARAPQGDEATSLCSRICRFIADGRPSVTLLEVRGTLSAKRLE